MLYFLMLALTLAASFLAPWWVIVPVAFAGAFFLARSGRQAFWWPLLGTGTGWVLLMAYTMLTSGNQLLYRMTAMLHLPHWTVLILLSALLGGLLAGMSGLSGRFVRIMLRKPAVVAEKPREEPAMSFILPDFNLQ